MASGSWQWASGRFVARPLLGPPGRLGQGRPGLGDADETDLATAVGRSAGTDAGALGSGKQLGLLEGAVWLHVLHHAQRV